MSILRGPADADHFRVKVGRYGDRWYADPLPGCDIASATDDSWPSVSIVKKASGSDWTFVALKRVAKAKLDGLEAELIDDRYERLKGINKRGLKLAQKRGTHVHEFFEDMLYGRTPIADPDFPEPGDDYLPAVQAFFDTYQPELVAAEMVFVNRGLGYGGTADAAIKIDGKVYWVDWKTRGEDSSHGAYPEEAAQVAAGACAEYMIIEGPDGPIRSEIPALDGGLIVSIKPDGCRIYPVALSSAYEHWHALHDWWTARRLEREPIGKPWAPRKIAAVEPRGLAPVAAGEGSPAQQPSPNHVEYEGRREWLIQRIQYLSKPGREVLAAQWPDSVPTFKQTATHTDQQLSWIEQAIIKAEAEVDAPFVTPLSKSESKSRFATPDFHSPADPFDGLAGQAWDEGGEVTHREVDALREALEKDATVRMQVEAWAGMCHADGKRSLSLKQKRTRWRYSVVSALYHAARSATVGSGSDDDLRDLIYGATGCWNVPLGPMIASLTIDEADRLAHLARHLGTDALVLTYTPDALPVWSGPAYQPPPGDAA